MGGKWVERGAGNAVALMQLGFWVLFLALAWAPYDRATWLMENAMVLIGAAAVWAARRQFYWSTRSWALVLAFLCTHEIATHFTYPKVPYEAGVKLLTGIDVQTTFGWQRNHYDRFVHLCYGLCFALPLREIITARTGTKGAWASLIAWSFVLATSMLYELMEWIGGAAVGGGNSAFVGAQGDFWDAQKDMAWAAGGSLLVLVCRGNPLRSLASAMARGKGTAPSTPCLCSQRPLNRAPASKSPSAD